jgi:hypothetical protein
MSLRYLGSPFFHHFSMEYLRLFSSRALKLEAAGTNCSKLMLTLRALP